MNAFALFFFATVALASATEELQTPIALKSTESNVDKTIGSSVAAGSSPLVAVLGGPYFRSFNAHPNVALVNNNAVVGVVGSTFPQITEGVQGPSVRTVNVGPEGSVIDSLAIGGAVYKEGSVIVPPSHYTTYGHTADHVVVHSVVPTVVPVTRSFGYTPEYYYSGYSYVHTPYGKSIIAGPSGTVVA